MTTTADATTTKTETKTITTHLARPLTLRSGLTFSNRFAKAALSEMLGDRATGAPTDRLIRLWERWGQGGAGMLITGNVFFDRGGMEAPGNVLIESDDAIPGLRRWAEAGQAGGTPVFVQINHAGRQTPLRIASQSVAPSAVPLAMSAKRLFAPPRALEEREILAIIAGYAATARRVRDAGFAGVEIHGAHGYLVSQFLSPLANVRDDGWGGDAERRRRFLLEIVRATRREVGQDFPIAVKLNSADFQRGGFSFEESLEVIAALDAEGIDLLEVSGGSYESPKMFEGRDDATVSESTKAREVFFLDFARRVRAVATLPVMLTGGFRTTSVMEDAVAAGEIDVVGLGRPMIVEPDLPRRILEGGAEGAMRIGSLALGWRALRELDSGAEASWYRRQLDRMAVGREPDPRLSAWWSLVVGFLGTYAVNPLRLILPRRRAAPVAGATA